MVDERENKNDEVEATAQEKQETNKNTHLYGNASFVNFYLF